MNPPSKVVKTALAEKNKLKANLTLIKMMIRYKVCVPNNTLAKVLP